jgi:transposase
MRGEDSKQATMLSLVTPEKRIPATHPLRAVKQLAEAALTELSPLFDAMYSDVGRPSIPPERLLKSSLLMALYTVRSERMFCEQLDYNLLFRWFLDMNMDEASFDATTFTKNRDRLLEFDVAERFFQEVVQQAKAAGLMSREHFTVDGTLIDAWASAKSFRRKEKGAKDRRPPDDPGNPSVNFHGEKRTNDTHESTTDPEAKLARKGGGKEAKLSFSQHVLMENRNGLIVDLRIAQATGTAEREMAIDMLGYENPDGRPATVGGDKNFDTKEFVGCVRAFNYTPHVAQNCGPRRRSAIDGRTTRQPGYGVSQRIRKRVEEIFGWTKTVGNFRKTRFKGVARTRLAALLVGAAYNLIRMARLLPQEAPT